MSAPSGRERYIPWRQIIGVKGGVGQSLSICTIDTQIDSAQTTPYSVCIFPNLPTCLDCPVALGEIPLEGNCVSWGGLSIGPKTA